MTYQHKTLIAERNLLVQSHATTVWLEVELPEDRDRDSNLTCVALCGDEAIEIGMALIQQGHAAHALRDAALAKLRSEG